MPGCYPCSLLMCSPGMRSWPEGTFVWARETEPTELNFRVGSGSRSDGQKSKKVSFASSCLFLLQYLLLVSKTLGFFKLNNAFEFSKFVLL